MNHNEPSSAKSIRYLHEACFSLNLALVLVAILYLVAPGSVTARLYQMDIAVSRYLHLTPDLKTVRVPKDIFTGGYFAFFVPGLALGLCIWASLRLSSQTRQIREILRSVAGVVAIGAAPVWWLWATYLHARWWNLLGAVQFCELALALFCVLLYLYGRWPIPRWSGILILLHYAFWFWQFRPLFATLFRGWGGSVAVTPVVGLGASLIWALYVSEQ